MNEFLKDPQLDAEFRTIKTINEQYSAVGYEMQQERLRALLRHAVQNVEAYRGGYQVLSDFPVVNKQIMLQDKEKYIVPEEKLGTGEYYVKTTSGSSGTPFSFSQDSVCRRKLTASLKYWNHTIGYHEGELILHMRSLRQYYSGANEKPDFVQNPDTNIIYVDNADMNEEKLGKICKILYEKHVRLWRGYLTGIDAVTEYAVAHGLKLHHDGETLLVLSNGEMLSESVRERVIKKLGCHIVSQYGSEELGVLGMSEIDRRGDKIKLDQANHYFEILKLDRDGPAGEGELGRIVVTDLSNYAMPFIRYDLGDLAVRGETVHGVAVTLDHLAGRRTDMICRTDGSFLDFFNSCPASIHNNEDISQWQFIQKTANGYRLNIKPRRENVSLEEEKFKADLRALLGADAQIEIRYEKDIPVQVSGKRKTVINEYRKR